ncbi:ATP-binding protein [Gordonibacter massiliensis (ex Traore et al. 2017)]|nr:ATP-binding protein [Gordonibacter massiliensis (ex Traore et al. 2017)]
MKEILNQIEVLMVPRPRYLKKLLDFKDTDFVKVITGVRRCGKSTLLKLFAEDLVMQGASRDRIIAVNFESLLAEDLRKPAELHRFVQERIERAEEGEGPYYILIDEAQEIERWAQTVNSLRATFPVDIYVTGSNSRLFAGEDLTYLAGRYVEVRMYPLSLQEFFTFRGLFPGSNAYPGSDTYPTSPEAVFDDYLSQGSFPAVALATNPQVIQALTASLIDSVVMRDVVQRGRIDNEALFMRVAQFVFDTIGSEVSAHRIANTLKSAGHSITANTVDRYLKLMCDAFVLYRCQRYDIRGKERLRTNGKYYMVDTGLRNAFLGERPCDVGHVLENVVFMELLRRGFEVSVGKIDDAEIDFVAVDHTDRVYVQVCRTLADEKVERREFSPLLAVADAYPKYVLSMDRIDYSHEGVRHMNIVDFLMGASLG